MVDRGEYPATRAWVRDADAKCAADRVLAPRTAAPRSSSPPPVSSPAAVVTLSVNQA